MCSSDLETKKEEGKANPGIIVAICAAVICVACVIVAILLTNVGAPKKPIVGSWKYSSMDAMYTFNEDGTCTYKFYDSERKCTYTDADESLEILFDGDTLASTFRYHIENEKILHMEDSFGQDVIYEKQ